MVLLHTRWVIFHKLKHKVGKYVRYSSNVVDFVLFAKKSDFFRKNALPVNTLSITRPMVTYKNHGHEKFVLQ